MSKVNVIDHPDSGGHTEKKVVLDNTPDLSDKSGEVFLAHLEEAVRQCRRLIGEGFRVVDFWSDPDQGIQFILKK